MRSGRRSYCLDMLFRKDPRGIEKFTKINTLLKDLSDIGDRARCALPGGDKRGEASRKRASRPSGQQKVRKKNQLLEGPYYPTVGFMQNWN